MEREKRSKSTFEVVLVAFLAAVIRITPAGTSTHVVGDSHGWSIPAADYFYSTSVAHQTFKVGDVLLFNFQTGNYTVAEVSQSDYDSCTETDGASMSVHTNGPANFTITTPGRHYYICIYPRHHCKVCVKLAITTVNNEARSTERHYDPVVLCID